MMENFNMEDYVYHKEVEESERKEHSIKELVKDNFVYFSFYRQGYLYYVLVTKEKSYRFPVPIADVGTSTLNQREKALLLMRWIRKAIDDKTFTEI